jgi:hypothetical protein
MAEVSAQRVAQLDADSLHTALLDVVMQQVGVRRSVHASRAQISNVVNTLPINAGNWARRVEPEIRFAVKTLFHFGALHASGMAMDDLGAHV